MSLKDFVETLLTFIHFRMHTTQDINTVFTTLASKYDYLIVACENEHEGRRHMHCLIGSTDLGKNNQNFRKFVKKEFMLQGNSDYSISSVRDKSKMITYILKDGQYQYQGFQHTHIEAFKKASFKKFDKVKFATELEKLRVIVVTNVTPVVDMYEGYFELKASYNQNISLSVADSIINKWYCQQNAYNRSELARSSAERFQRRLQGN